MRPILRRQVSPKIRHDAAWVHGCSAQVLRCILAVNIRREVDVRRLRLPVCGPVIILAFFREVVIGEADAPETVPCRCYAHDARRESRRRAESVRGGW
jgi:hypothetical protein